MLALLGLGNLAWLVAALAQEGKDGSDSKPLLLTVKPGEKVLVGGETYSLRDVRALADRIKTAQGSRIRARLHGNREGIMPITVAVDAEASCAQVQALLHCLEEAGVPQPHLLAPDMPEQDQALRVGFRVNRDVQRENPPEPRRRMRVTVRIHAVQGGAREGSISALVVVGDGSRQVGASPERLLRALQKLQKEMDIESITLEADPLLKYSEVRAVLDACRKAEIRTIRLRVLAAAHKPELTNTDIGVDPEPVEYNVDRIKDVSVPNPVDPPPEDVAPLDEPPLREENAFAGRPDARRLEKAGGNARSEAAVARGLK
jgi:biopolymer transport protein ExbD